MSKDMFIRDHQTIRIGVRVCVTGNMRMHVGPIGDLQIEFILQALIILCIVKTNVTGVVMFHI